ncbi:MAG: phosphoribosylglycinamide formyltransferase, partial [Sediminibacterium sp.]|nr:phosphoribosylglycinamide formyltransferase [Sediminibacterium sp.]
MFKRLQGKWGVTTRQFWIIFIIFGLTGTTTAILTRYITAWLGMDAGTWWVWKLLFRLAMLVIGYQFILLMYAALLGQWPFFWKYERKLLKKLGVWRLGFGVEEKPQTPNPKPQTKKIAIFASGAGSNARKIIERFRSHPSISVALIVSNKPDAGVLPIARENGISVLLIDKEVFFRGDAYVPLLREKGIEFIVLAGFLWKIPAALVSAYPGRIIN